MSGSETTSDRVADPPLSLRVLGAGEKRALSETLVTTSPRLVSEPDPPRLVSEPDTPRLVSEPDPPSLVSEPDPPRLVLEPDPG